MGVVMKLNKAQDIRHESLARKVYNGVPGILIYQEYCKNVRLKNPCLLELEFSVVAVLSVVFLERS